jgi:hypothetical protein
MPPKYNLLFKMPHIFSVLMTSFMALCVIQSIFWFHKAPVWHPSWWQDGHLAAIGLVFCMPAALLVVCFNFLENAGYHISDWFAFAACCIFVASELAAFAWMSYRIGCWWQKGRRRGLARNDLE